MANDTRCLEAEAHRDPYVKILAGLVATDRVIAIGVAAQARAVTLNVGKGDKRYSLHAYHVTHELDLLWSCLDRENRRSSSITQRRGGCRIVETSWRFFETNSMALAAW